MGVMFTKPSPDTIVLDNFHVGLELKVFRLEEGRSLRGGARLPTSCDKLGIVEVSTSRTFSW